MSFQERKDMGVRVGAEKAQLPDEAITKSQLEAGTNITLEHLTGPSWNIRISATTVGGGGGTAIRQIHGAIVVNLTPGGGQGQSHTQANFRYGDAKYIDIYHNWNLAHPDAFIFTLVDLNSFPAQTLVRHSTPKMIGIDVNTVRVWTTLTPVFGAANYDFVLMEKV